MQYSEIRFYAWLNDLANTSKFAIFLKYKISSSFFHASLFFLLRNALLYFWSFSVGHFIKNQHLFSGEWFINYILSLTIILINIVQA